MLSSNWRVLGMKSVPLTTPEGMIVLTSFFNLPSEGRQSDSQLVGRPRRVWSDAILCSPRREGGQDVPGQEEIATQPWYPRNVALLAG